MSSNQTFGAWLLDQQERQDSIGSMARSWAVLKKARGYKHSQEKSIRELLSAQLGDDWAQLQGDEVMNAAVAEWRGDFDAQPAQDNGEWVGGEQGTIFDLPGDAVAPPGAKYVGYTGGGITPDVTVPQVQPSGKVVLVINGMDVELPPGRYTLAIVVQPTEIPAEAFADAVAEAVAGAYLTPDGRLNWSALYKLADLTVPDGVDLSTLGLVEE